jgi:hypothetical protein
LLDPTPKNARRALAALHDFFGGVDLGYTVEDFTDPRWIIQLGVAPVRIDLHSGVSGIDSFDAAWKNRVEAQFGSVPTHYLGREDLIRTKEAVDRPQDRADIRVLQRARGQPSAKRRSGGSRPRRRG